MPGFRHLSPVMQSSVTHSPLQPHGICLLPQAQLWSMRMCAGWVFWGWWLIYQFYRLLNPPRRLSALSDYLLGVFLCYAPRSFHDSFPSPQLLLMNTSIRSSVLDALWCHGGLLRGGFPQMKPRAQSEMAMRCIACRHLCQGQTVLVQLDHI